MNTFIAYTAPVIYDERIFLGLQVPIPCFAKQNVKDTKDTMSDYRDRGDRGRNGQAGNRRRFVARPKVCQYCADKIRTPDYKDIKRLQRFVSDRGKIVPRRRTGTCARHQRGLTTAIKRARHLALLSFAAAQSR